MEKRNIRFSEKKFRDGKVTVAQHKTGFRTLNIAGKISLDSTLFPFVSFISPILKATCNKFLPVFLNFLMLESISDFESPEKKPKGVTFDINYDLTIPIKMECKISTSDILSTVSPMLSLINRHIKEGISEMPHSVKYLSKVGGI